MNELISYYKPLGLTPLQAIEQLRRERPELIDVPITYAGRLDPMAEGILLLLAGDAVHRKEEFLKSDKTYEAKILFGFSSDSFDVLGLAKMGGDERPSLNEIKQAVHSLTGEHEFEYPAFSSKTIEGKPMWELTKSGAAVTQPPKRKMTVYSANVTSAEEVAWQNIYANIVDSISLVSGDFRQTEILDQWQALNKTIQPQTKFTVANIVFEVSSGTYIRTLAHHLGRLLNNRALLYHLKRTEINHSIPLNNIMPC